MKRLVALLLVLTLTLGIGATAMAAGTEFTPTVMNALDQPISTYWISADTRALFGVLIMLDYTIASGESADIFDYTKTMYLQKYGDNSLYFYIGAKKGGYYELYYYKGTGSYSNAKCTYYSSYTSTSLKSILKSTTYKEITLTEFLNALTTLSSYINN